MCKLLKMGLMKKTLKTMIQIENSFFDLASSGGNQNCLVICDRGTMDASAFVSREQWDHILAMNSLNEVEIRDNRYNQVQKIILKLILKSIVLHTLKQNMFFHEVT